MHARAKPASPWSASRVKGTAPAREAEAANPFEGRGAAEGRAERARDLCRGCSEISAGPGRPGGHAFARLPGLVLVLVLVQEKGSLASEGLQGQTQTSMACAVSTGALSLPQQ